MDYLPRGRVQVKLLFGIARLCLPFLAALHRKVVAIGRVSVQQLYATPFLLIWKLRVAKSVDEGRIEGAISLSCNVESFSKLLPWRVYY